MKRKVVMPIVAVMTFVMMLVGGTSALATPHVFEGDTKNVISEQPVAPEGFDYCGTEFDVPTVPKYDASSSFSAVQTIEGGVTTVELVPHASHYFADGIIFKWTFTYTDVPCPVFIVTMPDSPTLCFGQVVLPVDTVDHYYGGDGYNVYAIAKDGRLFVQDLLKNDLDYIAWPISDLKETCKVPDVPAAIVPPLTPVSPVVDTTPVVETPIVVVEPITQPAPVSVGVEPVADAPASDTDSSIDTAVVAVSATTVDQLADTGLSVPASIAAIAALFMILLGVWAKFGTRPRVIKE